MDELDGRGRGDGVAALCALTASQGVIAEEDEGSGRSRFPGAGWRGGWRWRELAGGPMPAGAGSDGPSKGRAFDLSSTVSKVGGGQVPPAPRRGEALTRSPRLPVYLLYSKFKASQPRNKRPHR